MIEFLIGFLVGGACGICATIGVDHFARRRWGGEQ